MTGQEEEKEVKMVVIGALDWNESLRREGSKKIQLLNETMIEGGEDNNFQIESCHNEDGIYCVVRQSTRKN